MPRGSNPRSWANLKPGMKRGPAKATKDIREFARATLTDPAYIASLKARLTAGTATHMEVLLHHYGFGKPKDTLAVEGGAKPLVVDLLTAHESDAEPE